MTDTEVYIVYEIVNASTGPNMNAIGVYHSLNNARTALTAERFLKGPFKILVKHLVQPTPYFPPAFPPTNPRPFTPPINPIHPTFPPYQPQFPIPNPSPNPNPFMPFMVTPATSTNPVFTPSPMNPNLNPKLNPNPNP